MPKHLPIIDATVFMGMHHTDAAIRNQSLNFFTERFSDQVSMSFSQIGICDAIIWKKARELQDVYYPFMDVLHSEMAIQRGGYSDRVIEMAASSAELSGLAPEKRLQAAQVLESEVPFYTHDRGFHQCIALRPFLASFRETAVPGSFHGALQALYQASLALSVAPEDFAHV